MSNTLVYVVLGVLLLTEIFAAGMALWYTSQMDRDRDDCPDGPHRGPEGPNEDLMQCRRCWGLSHSKRPAGEEFGGHLPDCSLPRDHESYCVGGGNGHPAPRVVRG